jgi:LasA protease
MKRRLFITSLIISLLLASCGQTPALWGPYYTPTPQGAGNPPSSLALPPTIAVQPGQTQASNPAPTAAATATFTPTPTAIASNSTSMPVPLDGPTVLYYSQSGDTLQSVAAHFGVNPSDISTDAPIPETSLINPGTLLVIPQVLDETGPAKQVIPDSEVVYSATALDFDTTSFVRSADGYLYKYKEFLNSTGWVTGAGAIQKLAMENSINPRLMLAILEYEGHWVYGEPSSLIKTDYPLGYQNTRFKGMFSQMIWGVEKLSVGYYGWRDGTLTELTFPDGSTMRIAPGLNAGTVALQYFFSQLHNPAEWQQIMDPNVGFMATYTNMFDDPWARSAQVEPLFPPNLKQPNLVLPFEPGREWSFTGGPHPAWEKEGPMAAIDFAPSTDTGGCDESEKWIVASAPGLVVRSDKGVVMLDMDGDGYEQTGWSLLYLHVATKERVPLGQWVETNDHIGHASCEGGVATGTHLHFARKYNGEWVLTDGPMPFTLSGWVVKNGDAPYEGELVRGDKVVTADPVGRAKSIIFRDPDAQP